MQPTKAQLDRAVEIIGGMLTNAQQDANRHADAFDYVADAITVLTDAQRTRARIALEREANPCSLLRSLYFNYQTQKWIA